jgi:acetylornithine/N-succinyldiaminopimelate aminotransferase
VKRNIVRANGCSLYDSQGKRYIDFEAGVWCTLIGHNHQRVKQTIRKQIEQVIHMGYRYTNDGVEAAAAQVLDTFPLSSGKCIFLSSGSEAVEFGVQVARRITGQPLLLTLADSYLAAYGSAGRKSPEEWYCFDWGPCIDCPHSNECDPECSHFMQIPFERIGGMVFEPGNASGLVKFPPKQLVGTLTNMVRRQQGLVVIDEVTTGLGRTGDWYGFQQYLLQPDIISLGKGLGNGYPVSAVVMTNDIAERLERISFSYAQSHQNDPLGCAIANEVVSVIREDGLIERSHRIGKYFLHELTHLEKRYDCVKEIRGRGLMIVTEFEDIGERFSLNSVFLELVKRGCMVGYKPAANILRFYPPLTIGEDDIRQLLENLHSILKVMN